MGGAGCEDWVPAAHRGGCQMGRVLRQCCPCAASLFFTGLSCLNVALVCAALSIARASGEVPLCLFLLVQG